MRLRNLLIAVAVLAIAVPGIASAQKPAESGFKVTGGGQIIGDDHEGGAGDTVGFNAQRLNDETYEARGQFQYVPRGQSGNASAPEEKFHGVVTCLMSGGEAIAEEEAEDDGEFNEALEEGSARFGGYVRTKDGSTQHFTVDVTDNGQGGNAEDDDFILVRLTEEPCADNPEDEENDPEEMIRLGRGNVKIHNNPDGEATAASSAAATAAMVRMAL